MTKITKFDKPALEALRSDINEALASLAAEYGIDLSAGNASFNANNATFKLNCSLLNADGVAESRELTCLRAYYPALVNKEVTLSGGLKGKVIGYKPRATKYPFILKTAKCLYKISLMQAEA